jgi:hypothetical protein
VSPGRRALGALAAAFATALGLACQSIPPRDLGTALPLDDPRALERLAAHHSLAAERQSMRAAARLAIEGPGISLSRPQRLVVRRPASLRIEILGLFDQVVGIVVTDGSRFSFIDLASGTRDGGPVDDGVLWRTARVDLTPADAVALLLGAPRIDGAAELVEARQFSDGGIGAATRSADRIHVRWHEWDGAGRLRRAELREPGGRVVWAARFSDWEGAAEQPGAHALPSATTGQSFAHRIELEFPRVQSEVTVRFRAVELGPALSDGLFVLQVPPGG